MVDNLTPDTIPSASAQMRGSVRVNLFMAATLHAAGVEAAVKIRDLSASGAQVETPLLPEVGAPMTLTRGRLSVRGVVAWCAEPRCGLKFSSNITVKDWMANPVNREQSRVDHIVTAVKAGVVPLTAASTRAAAPADGAAQDLECVAKLLESLGDALASDPAVIAQHGIALQNLDIAIQTLTVLAEMLPTGSPADSARRVRLTELRASCAEALRSAG
ncbi:MAG: PilZ domain-containing protein [Sphingomicrobium sp.]